MRSAVVLPAPFGPSSPQTCPAPTVKSRWSTASTVPYRLVRSRTSTGAAVVVVAVSATVDVGIGAP